jgi:predicted RNA-binding Zn-ribbon protein involved in translation (DUF1610 family)
MKMFKLGINKKTFSLQFPEVTVTLVEIERFREQLALFDCPSCGEKALKLVSYVQGPTGWSSTFFCTSCDTRGELNSDGFSVELTEAKKEPQEEEPKPKQRREIKK